MYFFSHPVVRSSDSMYNLLSYSRAALKNWHTFHIPLCTVCTAYYAVIVNHDFGDCIL